MSEQRQWRPKMLREQLCNHLTLAPDAFTRGAIRRLINVLDPHRPLVVEVAFVWHPDGIERVAKLADGRLARTVQHQAMFIERADRAATMLPDVIPVDDMRWGGSIQPMPDPNGCANPRGDTERSA